MPDYTQKSKYDYSKHIAVAKKESQYTSFPIFIDEKIHECRSAYFDGEAKRFNRSTIASMIGVELNTLTKIINGSQTTRKRDIIIALCFVLKLSTAETTQALNLYPMAPLNPNNLRDLVIMHALQDRLSVADLNDTLKTHGFPQLNVTRSIKKGEENAFYYPLASTTYEEISVEILPTCMAGDDSLHDRYRPDHFDYKSKMIICKKEENAPKLCITLDGNYYRIGAPNCNPWDCLYSNEPLWRKYTKPCDDHELLNEVDKLKEYTDQRARYVHNMCADTRNYGHRFDAQNSNGQFMIYGEGFNYNSPELCEYYQLELSSSSSLFTISNTSHFMERYLGKEQWQKWYGVQLSPVSHSFTSLAEISKPEWRLQFQHLLSSAREFLGKIRNRELFLCNAREYIEIDDLMYTFNVVDAFDCICPEDQPYDIIPQKDQIIGPDGNPVTINDLYRAAELEIFSIEELCDIRTKYGSLEDFLRIDLLNE